MFYTTTAKTENFIITHNVFANSTEYIFRNTSDSDDLVNNLIMDDNVWFQQPGDGRSLVFWENEIIYDFTIYQEKTGLDKNSVFTCN